MSKNCNHCSTENLNEASFCKECGAKLIEQDHAQNAQKEVLLAPEESFRDFFLNSSGRTGRQEYFFRAVIPLLILSLFLSASTELKSFISSSSNLDDFFSIGLGIFFLYYLYVLFNTAAKRFHDLNEPSWKVILLFVPILGIVFSFMLLFSNSVEQDNKFGKKSAYMLTTFRKFLFVFHICLALLIVNVASIVENIQSTNVSQTNIKHVNPEPIKQPNKNLNSSNTSCENGNIDQCFEIGLIYQKGDTYYPQNLTKAAEYYQKACNGNHAGGCNNLGVAYRKGEGVTQNLEKAAYFYKKACEYGESLGCSNLATMYEYGIGVTQNYEVALEFYKKADPNYQEKQYTLHVTTSHASSIIKILNIVPKFYSGMNLPKGKYHLEISSDGYKTIRQWVTLDKNENLFFTLEKNEPQLTQQELNILQGKPNASHSNTPSATLNEKEDCILKGGDWQWNSSANSYQCSKKNVNSNVTTSSINERGLMIYQSKCFSCHGPKASKSALNKSQIIAGWSAARIISAVKGYKNGEGGAMKGVMKPIASGLSNDDLNTVADTISKF